MSARPAWHERLSRREDGLMTQKTDDICRELLAQTRRILESAGREDTEAIGEAIARRQVLLARLAEVHAERPAEIAACQPLLAQVAALDAQAAQAVGDLKERVRQELGSRSRSYRPLLRYGSNQFSAAAGMVLDRKD